MKCHTLFSGKSKKDIIHLLSTELAQKVVKVKHTCICTKTDEKNSTEGRPVGKQEY